MSTRLDFFLPRSEGIKEIAQSYLLFMKFFEYVYKQGSIPI